MSGTPPPNAAFLASFWSWAPWTSPSPPPPPHQPLKSNALVNADVKAKPSWTGLWGMTTSVIQLKELPKDYVVNRKGDSQKYHKNEKPLVINHIPF